MGPAELLGEESLASATVCRVGGGASTGWVPSVGLHLGSVLLNSQELSYCCSLNILFILLQAVLVSWMYFLL